MIRQHSSPGDISLLAIKRRRSSPNNSDSFPDSGFDEFFADGGVSPSAASTSDPFYGLNTDVRKYLREQRGIRELYEWQQRCLVQQMAKPKTNLIVTLPTGGGKTLLAEILILKTLLFKQKDVLFVLPFVSLVQEKVRSLQPLGLEFGFLVEEYAGSRGRIPPIKRRVKKSVYVATIERSQTLINSLVQSKRIDAMGLIIIDELHMIGEGQNRGAKLEQVIVTLHLAAKHAKIIGLSATLSNVEEVKQFLRADVFVSDFRPVPLTEFVKLGNTLYKVRRADGDALDGTMEICRKVENSTPTFDPDGISDLVNEVVPQASCLIFCSTKKNTESLASLLTKTLPKSLRQHKTEEKRILLSQLKSETGGSGLCPIQNRCIEFGVSYHHAGLTTEERNLLQEAFLNGTLCVICCTSTLAAGVNLPAKRVILRCPLVGNKFLSRQQYRQMSGRAGRAGLDTSGESILVINGKQLQQTRELLRGTVEHCCSGLIEDDGLGRYLLNVIGLELVTHRKGLYEMIEQTLASIQQGKEEVTKHAESILSELISIGLVKEQPEKMEENGVLSLSEFGRAVLDSGISSGLAVVVRNHLVTSVQCLVLSTHLHLFYCIIPFDRQDDIVPNWDVFYDEFCRLTPQEKKVFGILSLSEAYLLKRKAGKTKSEGFIDEVAERLYLALVIRRLWNQESIWEVADRFHISRGSVQSLSQACAASASSLTRFVDHMHELWALKSLLPDFSKRLTYCVKPELMPLMEIQGVKRARANQLYLAGFTSPSDIAKSNVDVLMQSIEHLSRRQANQIITSAKMWLREKGELLVEAAEASGLSIEELITTLSQSI